MIDSKLNIDQFLDQDEKKDLLRLLTAGSVDDGKSTLIGRLLFDSKKLYEDQLTALERDSKRVGNAGEEIDYALLLDGLKAEREQGITIDVAYRYFSTNKRKFIIADTPGHEQYTRNMITGGSTANLAIILVDARTGVITQTKRHTYLVSLLGIKHVVLAINKMDIVDYKEEVYNQISEDYKDFASQLNIPDIQCMPLSALKGDNVVDKSENMPWYHGPSLLDYLETVHVVSDRNFEDFRFPIQYVLRPNLDFRGFSGKVASGIIRKGDEIMAIPSGKKSKVSGIHTYEGELEEAFCPQGITLTLEDEIDISRGEMLVHSDSQPKSSRQFEAMLVWMDEQEMNLHTQFVIKHTTNKTKARIDEIQYQVDVNTLDKLDKETFSLNEIGRVTISTNQPLFFDPYYKNKSTGAFVLIDPVTNNTCSVGMIIDKAKEEDLYSRIADMDREKMNRGESLISVSEREERYNQRGQTIWITGLHGSGKRELAYTIEKALFDKGKTVVVFDGATVRAGLSHELDYSLADRAEHLRRVAHMCKLLNDQGVIAICAFISPNDNIRQQVKEIIGEDRFTLAYINKDVEECKKAQPDLYGKYENEIIKNLPGMDLLYEVPTEAIFIDDITSTSIILESIK
ncbi:sulfate adenylyltransferase subunit CysN [Carboxylicivirga mesophila]|uniref:Sulfate adenylyltransferase subunit 1 n=1 Tax=Carboxylicivirga mesophila TaxID=1166478 RepID=A0ABS5K5F3_9BACT|nr:sulfate adenylyltransferase subunit CysN [Carboxylicivirga mesophila]MBS2210205.1 sulfate adenylyltransferase subunit CysN [Carboxylicivirga mesophila]